MKHGDFIGEKCMKISPSLDDIWICPVISHLILILVGKMMFSTRFFLGTLFSDKTHEGIEPT
jgi:hypothetical protein